MTFKCHSTSSVVVPIESWLLKTTFLLIPLVFDLEFEGRAVGM